MSAGEIVLRQWVIYDHPRDYPDGYVVREWHIVRGSDTPVVTDNARTAASIEGARAWVPEGLICIGRYPEDDPNIAAVWT